MRAQYKCRETEEGVMAKRAAIYVRVSTDKQTVENQTRELRQMIRQRIHAGLKRAAQEGRYPGRPRISDAMEKRIQSQLQAGKGILKVARKCGVGTGTVQRIKDEMSGPFDAAAVA